MIIKITLPTDDYKDTYTIEKNVIKDDVIEANILDFSTITKEVSHGEYIYHITDNGTVLPDLYYFVNTEDGGYNLVNTCIRYDELD